MEDLQAQVERVRQELIATEERYNEARTQGNRRDVLQLEGELDRLNREMTDLLERMRQPQA
ncbi:MAG TPA: hypothetical protein VGW38_13595 [Chloroflexota bacterium]|nr:hypothetical protein [Chloroflexota bacterium]